MKGWETASLDFKFAADNSIFVLVEPAGRRSSSVSSVCVVDPSMARAHEEL